MRKNIYFDTRESTLGLCKISKKEWEHYLNDGMPYRRSIRVFENETLHIELHLMSIADIDKDAPDEYATPFYVEVNDIVTKDFEGNPIQAKRVLSTASSKCFRDYAQAETYFDAMLTAYTESVRNEDGTIKEVGNLLAPPDPDIPTVDETSPMADDFGSW